MRQLDLSLLHTFKTIAQCKSLSLASQRLHKTQAAISIQLKKLEELVGKRLLDRGHQTAELTPHGELLLQYASKMLALSDEAMDLFIKEQISGAVRFGIPDDYASAFLRPVLRDFIERYPNVRLHIRNDISQNLFTALEQGELDLALVTRRNNDGNADVLRCDALHWVAGESFTWMPQTPLPLALYPHGCGFRGQILSALSASQCDYEIVFECTGVAGVQLAVDSGLAIAATSSALMQPGWQVLDAAAHGLPVLGNVMIELRLANQPVPVAVQQFAEELRKQVSLR
ncbi:LysR substrate-binding domain-containing protein [Pseudomonas sp. 7P_10.2_Bac1]|uniref:LysR substrate-binding domain-containing protein n=1 Tax=Pseudomonas sp. 7P_10.2_Bac1 TaxID=2971614 RepID=UPI0021C56D61|nr:LysR substrate-binding domain-containing protein [Pseudomonas sp. 7P_10.2_Bac1]MCU1726975.1 LysR substrate-binding domain-containing protein [Pseudomonas sp. 7P_10.2_Bac1]